MSRRTGVVLGVLAAVIAVGLAVALATSSEPSTTSAERATTGSEPPGAGGRWSPAPGATWHWQLAGDLARDVPVDVYDVDLFDTPAETVAELRARGVRVVCYVNAGAWEDWRPDAGDVPDEVLGAPLDGWPGERWLDVRRLRVLEPLLAARFDACVAKGFDGVEPDNVDAYANASGFPLTADDQLAFNRMVARLAHDRGLSVGLKNDVDQVADLVDDFDFAVDEECYAHGECATLAPFVAAGKAVFHVEYDIDTSEFCPVTTRLGFSSQRKRRDLGEWSGTCGGGAPRDASGRPGASVDFGLSRGGPGDVQR